MLETNHTKLAPAQKDWEQQWSSELEKEWREGVALRRTKWWISEINHFLFRCSYVQKYLSTSHTILQIYVQIQLKCWLYNVYCSFTSALCVWGSAPPLIKVTNWPTAHDRRGRCNKFTSVLTHTVAGGDRLLPTGWCPEMSKAKKMWKKENIDRGRSLQM